QVFYGVLEEDAFAAVFQLIFLSVGLIVTLSSVRYIQEDRNQGEYYSLLLLSVSGMLIVAASTDLITIFVGLALTALSGAALTAFRKKDKTAAEAAMKFYIVSALSAALALYGISLLYGVTHTLSLTGIRDALAGLHNGSAQYPTALLALVLIIAGFGFEIALVPFHMWAPDVYQGSPTPVSGLLTSGSKKVGFAALFKVFIIALFVLRADWGPLLGVLAILTMTVGNVAALRQDSVKRMLAYSSIGQAGYMLIAFSVFTSSISGGNYTQLSYLSVSYGIFQIMTHSIATAGAFAVVAVMSGSVLGLGYEDFKGLFRRNRTLAVTMTLFLFSLLGVPLLAGFDSKLLIFSAAIGGSLLVGYSWLVWLAIFGILNSAVSLIYYVKLVRNMFSDEQSKLTLPHVSTAAMAAIVISAVLVVFIGVYPGPFISACNQAAHALMSEV
ncbi:MAG: NADH-quinone oxidoreductase subunit N, partial [Methanomassiliicoccales archaeon]